MSQLINPKDITDAFKQFYKNHPYLVKQIVFTSALMAVKGIARKYKKLTPSNTILELDFDQFELTYTKLNKIERLFNPKTIYIQDLIDAIVRAANDKKVKALVCRLSDTHRIPLFMIQELRDAILLFKSKNKPSVVYSESFGEFSNSIGLYYLATAFSEIYMAQCGSVGLVGVNVDIEFIRKTLEKLGCTPEFFKRKEYKGAADMLTEEKLTEPNREALTSIFNDLFDQIHQGIAKERGFTVDQLKEIFSQGPFNSDISVQLNLINGTKYIDQVYKELKEKIEKKPKLLYLTKYMVNTTPSHCNKSKNLIALINAEGAIYRGESKSTLNGGPSVGSESVSLAIRAATLDKNVKCILIRVHSPGGSYIASDLIHHEIQVAKEAGKKVVVHMGGYAASGGYYISCNADKIVACPATITGSVGVLAGKLDVKPMWEKIGVTFDSINLNTKKDQEDNSTIYSSLHPYNNQQKETMNKFMDYIYEDFTSKVAAGRKLGRDQVEQVARGRVWTGRQALDRGLVDKLGSFSDAVQVAKELCQIPADQTPNIVEYPKDNIIQKLLSSSTPYNSEEVNRKGSSQAASMVSSSFTPILSTIRWFNILVSVTSSIIGSNNSISSQLINSNFNSSSSSTNLLISSNFMNNQF